MVSLEDSITGEFSDCYGKQSAPRESQDVAFSFSNRQSSTSAVPLFHPIDTFKFFMYVILERIRTPKSPVLLGLLLFQRHMFLHMSESLARQRTRYCTYLLYATEMDNAVPVSAESCDIGDMGSSRIRQAGATF